MALTGTEAIQKPFRQQRPPGADDFEWLFMTAIRVQYRPGGADTITRHYGIKHYQHCDLHYHLK